MNFAALLPYLSTFLALCITVGGLFAMRQGYSKQATEIQEKVIGALQAQNEAQETQIATCEKEIARLKRVVSTIQYALKRRGLRIEIDGDAITVVDEQSRQSRTVQIRLSDKTTNDEDDEAAPLRDTSQH